MVSYLLEYNFISAAMIIGIVIMLIENRKERPYGTEHIAIIVLLLSVIVVNTEIKEWFEKVIFDENVNYRGDSAMGFMYLRSAVEHILFPMIAYIELLLIAPVKKKYVLFIPEFIVIVSEVMNLCGLKIIFTYDNHLKYHDGVLFLLPYFVGMIYLMLLLRYSISFLRAKKMSKGIAVVFIVFLTLLECYLEAAYIVVDLMDEIVALDVIIFYFYLVAIYQSETKIKLRTSELELERSRRLLTLSQI